MQPTFTTFLTGGRILHEWMGGGGVEGLTQTINKNKDHVFFCRTGIGVKNNIALYQN